MAEIPVEFWFVAAPTFVLLVIYAAFAAMNIARAERRRSWEKDE